MARFRGWACVSFYCASGCLTGRAAWVPPGPLLQRCSPLTQVRRASTGGHDSASLQRAPRLYFDKKLSESVMLELDKDQSHYLGKVMRLREGDVVRAFNGKDGEWVCRLVPLSAPAPTKRGRQRDGGVAGLTVETLLRPQKSESTPFVTLCFAPIKRTRLKILVEKATELGVDTLQPLTTEFTDLREGHVDDGLAKMDSAIVEASEQSERLSLPRIMPVEAMATYLNSKWDPNTLLYVCRERSGGQPLFQVLQGDWGVDAGEKKTGVDASAKSHDRARLGFLVGPEGGFSPKELQTLSTLPFVRFVSLGSTVLRSETAAIAALGCWAAFRTEEGEAG